MVLQSMVSEAAPTMPTSIIFQFRCNVSAEAMLPEPPGWFSFGFTEEDEKGSWTVEDNVYTILKHKLSRVYAAPPQERLKSIYNTPPSKFETIDKGSKLGFTVIRMVYEDFYLCSPGSFSQKYGNGYLICTGPASVLVPVETW